MKKLIVVLMLSVMIVMFAGCTNTLRGVGQLVEGFGKDVVNIADDNDSGTAARYGYHTVRR